VSPHPGHRDSPLFRFAVAESRAKPTNFGLKMRRCPDRGPPRQTGIPLSIPVTWVRAGFLPFSSFSSFLLPSFPTRGSFPNLTYSANPPPPADISSRQAGNQRFDFWHVGLAPTRCLSRGRDALRSTEPKKRMGTWDPAAFPTVCKDIPRFSRPKIASEPPCPGPVLAMYLRSTRTNTIRQTLIWCGRRHTTT
jgi:hypothetical protein